MHEHRRLRNERDRRCGLIIWTALLQSFYAFYYFAWQVLYTQSEMLQQFNQDMQRLIPIGNL